MSRRFIYLLLAGLLLAVFSLKPYTILAQPADSAAVSNLQYTVKNLADTVQQGQAEMRRHALNGSMLVIDTTAVQYAQAHPDSLYSHSICKAANQHGPYAATGWLRCIITLLLLLGMWYFAYIKFTGSSLCRDICYNADGSVKPSNLCPYSYSRVQLFWWTMIILSCYLYSYAITGVLIPVNETIGVLMGFSVTVYAGGRLIDKRQIITNPPNTRSQDTQNGSQGLFTDIMSDDIGISIHRFQTVVFNIVFGLGFFFFFINGMQGHIYPFADFSAWQYGLLGISSAAYLGLKTAENDSSVIPGAAMNNNANNNAVNQAVYNQQTVNSAVPQAGNYTPPVPAYTPPAPVYTPPATDTAPGSADATDNSAITQS